MLRLLTFLCLLAGDALSCHVKGSTEYPGCQITLDSGHAFVYNGSKITIVRVASIRVKTEAKQSICREVRSSTDRYN